MKKLVYLLVLALILGLVLTGCSLLSNVGQVPNSEQSGVNSIIRSFTTPTCIDFEVLGNEGDSVEGFLIGEMLNIELVSTIETKQLILVQEGTSNLDYLAYRANNPNPNDTNNGCLTGFGFAVGYPNETSKRLKPEDEIVFSFPEGVTVSYFSIDMFDYGDWYPEGSGTPPKVILTGDDGSTSEYSFTHPASAALYDACQGTHGIKKLEISGTGINQVRLSFDGYMDPGVAFDNICFTPEPIICSTYLWAGNPKNGVNDVGDVMVEYIPFTDHLTVTYNTEDGWLMDEIHFHVATEPGDFPQKNGNPIPGQFDYKFEDLGGVETYSFPVSLLVPCGQVNFAAHAEVYKLSDVIDEFIVSEAGSSMVYAYEEDTTNLGYPSSTLYKSGSAVEALYPSWPGISGAKWISLGDWLEDVADSDPDNHKEGWWGDYVSSWWEFERTIDIPLNAVNISGTLTITSDNVESIELNSIGVGGYTEVYGAFSDSGQWGGLNTHNIDLLPGQNDLNIMVRNFPRPEGTGYDNPIGLIYKLEYQYQLKTEETAWGEGTSFSGKNWAMYFGCPIFLPECS